MFKQSLRLFLSASLLTLSLASFALAGDSHCPDTPPPPPEDEGGRGVAQASNSSVDQVIKGFWEFLAQGSDLF